MVTEENILDLINNGEGVNLDFKEAITSKEKIAKTLVAFANTSGGSLLIGVKDNGRIKGVDTVEEREMLLWASEKYTLPVVELLFKTIVIRGKSILVATVLEGEEKPYYALDESKKKWSYLRVKDETTKASKVMLEVMRTNNRGIQAKINYGEVEKAVLDFLEKQEFSHLNQICKTLKIPRRKVMGILVNLIRMGVVKVNLEEEKDYYYV